jgi:acetyl-CoA carboxylase biotin carboxyl carrier protein
MPDSKPNPMPEIDPKLVRDLARILRDTDLSEIEVERGELRVRVARTLTAPSFAAPAPTYLAAPAYAPAIPAPTAGSAPQASSVPAPAAAAPAAASGSDWNTHPGVVKSPMVGTVYLQAEPGAPLLVKVGDNVGEGQTLMIIEAMKTMNPIPAPRSGAVLAVLVSDTDPVEFGEPLIVIG